MTIWIPDHARFPGPRYLAIADAIAASLADGRLKPGSPLPPQRDLAHRLGLSLSTVTRAYAEAERRGLVQGEVGRGTFVREAGPLGPGPLRAMAAAPEPGGMIDLSLNLPASGPAPAKAAALLAKLGADAGMELLDHDAPSRARHAAAGASWLERHGMMRAAVDQVFVTVGAQHGTLAALLASTRPGDAVLTEALTYPAIKQLARHLNLELHPVAMDEDGLLPDALDAACRRVGAKTLYLMPTLHCATAATMPDERRRAIGAIARHHGLTLIEDDVFGRLPDQRPPPIAAYAPERTLLVTSLSKSAAPWLRIGYLYAPEDRCDAIRVAIHMTCWMVPPLMAEIAARWIEDGAAEALVAWQRDEAKARAAIARAILAPVAPGLRCGGLHLWLELPRPWRAQTFQAVAERHRVRIVPAEMFAVDSAPPDAVRLALGRPRSQEQLHAGLTILRDLLHRGDDVSANVI